MIERRQVWRRDFAAVIEYASTHESAETCKGVTVDICESGLSLYLFRRHARGEEITIRTDLPVSPKTASVRWIRRVDESVFRAGLMFV